MLSSSVTSTSTLVFSGALFLNLRKFLLKIPRSVVTTINCSPYSASRSARAYVGLVGYALPAARRGLHNGVEHRHDARRIGSPAHPFTLEEDTF